MKTDTRFWLKSMLEKEFENKIEYKHFQREIKNRGYYVVITDKKTVKIYTPELTFILTTKQVPALEDLQKETFINGFDYLNSYIDGFQRGERYFEKEFKVSPNTLYGLNAKHYVRDIHSNYFHVQHKSSNQGWSYVKTMYPFILTHKAVKEYGYYSGIVSMVDEQVEKHPQLFATFDKCDHDLPQKQFKNQIGETYLYEKITNHFGFFSGKCPRKHKQILHPEDFKQLIEWTVFFYKNQFEVPQITKPIRIVNTNKTFVQLAFRYLFKELHKERTYPDSLFDFYKSAFRPYSKDKKENFMAVKNNDDVKKLMQIDY